MRQQLKAARDKENEKVSDIPALLQERTECRWATDYLIRSKQQQQQDLELQCQRAAQL